MSITDTGSALFRARDGNGGIYEDVRIAEDGEETDFIIDADGNEVREGDFVEVLPGAAWPDWVGRVARVTRAERGTIYGIDLAHGPQARAWSPTCALNGVQVTRRRHSTGFRWHLIRRVNLTEEDGQRLLLGELLDERASLDTAMATLQGKRVTLSVRIARVRSDLGEEVRD